MELNSENNGPREKTKSDKEEFINMGALFHDLVFHSVARKMKVICCC